VCNYQTGTTYSQSAECFLHDTLGVGIYIRSRFVHYEYRRISQDSTGETGKLALTGTQVATSLTYRCVVTHVHP
jgi:hypothetical protein